MIQFNHVSKTYTQGHTALSNITLDIADGEMAFLTGHSGAGKSTLLKLIMCIEHLSHGQLIVNKKTVSNLSKRQIPLYRRQIGMVFQNPQLLPYRTIFDNVAIPLYIAGYRPREIKKRAHAALDKVGLLAKAHLLPLALSTGEQQRVGIARAVVNKPPILLADEPTGNLDPELSLDIINLFAEFNRVGVTVLLATHDLALIAAMSFRIIMLKAGQLIGAQPHV